jgi:chemotaxis protein CheX
MAGNARRNFGSSFNISVPVVIRGNAQAIQVPKDVRAYIFPIKWGHYECALVVSVN